MRSSSAFKVLPWGPRIRWRRLTKRSLFLTKFLIFTMSHATPSSSILTACGAGTLRASSFIRSRALRMAAGSKVLRVVFTVMEPSIRSRVQAMACFSNERVMRGQAVRR